MVVWPSLCVFLMCSIWSYHCSAFTDDFGRDSVRFFGRLSARLILGEEIALAWVHDFNLNTFDL
jgi:hypothetical protein